MQTAINHLALRPLDCSRLFFLCFDHSPGYWLPISFYCRLCCLFLSECCWLHCAFNSNFNFTPKLWSWVGCELLRFDYAALPSFALFPWENPSLLLQFSFESFILSMSCRVVSFRLRWMIMNATGPLFAREFHFDSPTTINISLKYIRIHWIGHENPRDPIKDPKNCGQVGKQNSVL